MQNKHTPIEGIVKSFRDAVYRDDDALFDREGNNVSREVEFHLRQTLQSQADQYERQKVRWDSLKDFNEVFPEGTDAQKSWMADYGSALANKKAGEMVREMLEKSIYTESVDEWSIFGSDIKTIAQKYGVDLSE